MIYLLGVYHRSTQVGTDKTTSLLAGSFLEKIVKELDITCIAEEFNEYACQQKNIQESTIKKLCRTLGIKHRYCDPNEQQRSQLGIPNQKNIVKEINIEFQKTYDQSKDDPTTVMEAARDKVERKYFPPRENYWLSKIKDIEGNIIFVCGTTHLDSFSKLLKSKNFKVKYLNNNLLINNFY